LIGGPLASRSLALLGALFLVGSLLLAAAAPAALAIPPGSGVFQLEGNAVDDGAGDDWENVDDGNDGAVQTYFAADTAGRRFTEGSKDILDMPSNAWDIQSVPHKDDILHAYAAFYGGSDPVITFGLDRYANNGDANVGFWFYQDDIGLNANGTFGGNRTVNDLFIVSEFDNGGDVSTIVVYRWNGSGLTQVDSGADCVANGAQQTVCALANADDETAPWSYTSKSGSSGTFPKASFFEGGVLLEEIFPDGAPCFSTFMAETRASTETTAQLKNFLLGSFDTCGKVTIVKNAVPNDAQDFSFDGDFGDFKLDDDGNATLDREITFDNIDPGTYEVSEIDIPGGWRLVDIDCDDANSTGDGATATIRVGQTEHVTCTFTNEQDGRIVTVKETDPDGSPQSFGFAASWDGGDEPDFSLTDGQSNDSGLLEPGTYAVEELTPYGWDLTAVSCDDGSDNDEIDLDPGETVTCTFSNRQEGKIIVVKQTNPDGDPQSFAFSASYDADGFNLSDGQSNDSGLMDPGTYSVSETVPVGWDLTSATCSDGSTPGSIALGAGETVTCTFTNTKRGTILVDKVTNPSGDPQVFDFAASWDGGPNPDFGLADQSPLASSGLIVPGTYSASETVPAGWDLTSATCSDGSSPSAIDLGAGETVTCTFTNTKRGHIIVDKNTVPAGDPQSFSFDAGGAGYADFSLTHAAAPNDQVLVPGTYSVSETVPAGWDLTSATCSDGSSPSSIGLAAGETVTCTFVNTKRGTIIVEKQTSPDGASGSFTFTGSAAGSIGDGGQIVVGDLVPGTYTSTEADPGSDWVLNNIVCDDDNSSGNVGSRTATFALDPGETVKCTFFNSQRGRITVIKQVVNDDGDTTFDFTSDYGDPFTLGDGESNTSSALDKGSYAVGETLPDGWELMSIECQGTGGSSGTADGTSANIDLTDGGTVSCLFTNGRPSISIVKTAGDAPDGGTYQFLGGDVEYTYLVTNTGPIDLIDVEVVDDNGTPDAADDFVVDCKGQTTLAAGASMTCTAAIDVSEPGFRINIATVTATTEGETDVSDLDSAIVRVVEYSLLLDKSNDAPPGPADLPTVEEGDTITYTLAYTTQTNDVITNATIVDELPEGVTYVEGSATSDGQFDFVSYTANLIEGDGISGTLVWEADEVTESGSLSYKATADEGSAELAQPLRNLAVVDSDQTPEDGAQSDVFVNPPPEALTPPPTDASGRGQAETGMNLAIAALILGGIGFLATFLRPAPVRVRARRPRR
jgi:uncharacterized repeat protein (TIGR01451 family)